MNADAGRRDTLAAIAILIGGLSVCLAIMLSPLLAALQERAEVRERVAAFQSAAAELGGDAAAYDPAEIAARHVDAGDARLALQTLLSDQAQGAGFTIQSISPAGEDDLQDVGRIVWVTASLSGDLEAVTRMLAGLNAAQPLVLVRTFEITARDQENPDRNLDVRIEAGRAWRQREVGS